MSFSNGMTGCSCGKGYLDSCPDCNESSPCSYVPTEYEMTQIKKRRKLQEELERKQKEEFEKVYNPFLNLLKQMYPGSEEKELRKFFRRVPKMANKDNLILENVIVFLDVHKDNIKKKLDLTETSYLVSFFFRGVRYTSPYDMKIPGHMDNDCKWVSLENLRNIFNFLLEVNICTFKGKTLFSPNNWRRQSMDYLNPLITMLHVLKSCRGYDYRKIFRPCLIQACEVFSKTEGDQTKNKIWMAVLTSGDYGTRYVWTKNPLNFSLRFFSPICKKVFSIH
jgi:hypothetical protein